jgi:cytochrome c553
VYLRKIITILLILIALGVATVYVWSQLLLNNKYNIPMNKISVSYDEASIREGARLVRIEHCLQCHGEKATSRIVETIDHEVLLVAPNITTINSIYTDEELERLIRHGVKKNGTSVFFMPSNMYYELKDEAVAKIIAYLRTLKPTASPPNLPSSIVFYPH